MKARLARVASMGLVLALVPILVNAQVRRRQSDPPEPPTVNSCTAPGIRCLLGYANGCTATCPESRNPYCQGARCFLGFPIAPVCTCI